jgi:hypothetical protein
LRGSDQWTAWGQKMHADRERLTNIGFPLARAVGSPEKTVITLVPATRRLPVCSANSECAGFLPLVPETPFILSSLALAVGAGVPVTTISALLAHSHEDGNRYVQRSLIFWRHS